MSRGRDVGRGRIDARWPELAAALAALRADGRCSVRIVDADCGDGNLLIVAVRHAAALGFTAVEGRGIDGVPLLIAQARTAAARVHHPAIGLSFEVADVATALAEEAFLPAEILLWHGSHGGDRPETEQAISAAGRKVIRDRAADGASGSERAR
jgi:hypothetical protein